MRSRSRLLAASTLVAIGCMAAPPAHTAAVSTTFTFSSSITATITGPIPLRAELNYDDARTGAPIAVVMAGYSPTSGNLDAVRPHAQRLRDRGFFAVSVAMRGRDGSAGVRDSGGLEIHDIWDAVEAVKAQYAGFVDPTNVHITGYSGGGGNVMSAIVRFPDYFRVGASFFGMADYGFDPVDGWYNNGAGSRTSILDQDVGNPNTGGPTVLDRYHARASNLAASNSRYVEVHLFVNDNETICPLVNHATFAANGGGHITHHVGVSASPTYQDFNGNGVEDPGERQLWPHGFPSADQQDAAEQWYRDRLLAGQIPEPEIDPTGSFLVQGFLRTRRFEVWPGNGQNAAGSIVYATSQTTASFTPTIVSSDPGVPISLVIESAFMKPAGATVEARRNGAVIDTFPAGVRRVYYGLVSGDTIDLELVAPPLPLGAGPIGSLVLFGAPIVLLGLRRLRRPGQ